MTELVEVMVRPDRWERWLAVLGVVVLPVLNLAATVILLLVVVW